MTPFGRRSYAHASLAGGPPGGCGGWRFGAGGLAAVEVGAAVGKGIAVGADVGADVGVEVGAEVGEAVGEAVGARVMQPTAVTQAGGGGELGEAVGAAVMGEMTVGAEVGAGWPSAGGSKVSDSCSGG